MSYCDTCGCELDTAHPFAVCPKCLFGSALSREDGPALSECLPDPASAPASDPGDPPLPGAASLFARRDFFLKYEILERVAQGGQGGIWKVWDFELRRCLAMKRLDVKALGSEAAVYRFLAEAQIASQLEHPGILPIFEAGLDPDGRPFYTTQLLPGTTLGDIWRQVGNPQVSEWTIPRALELLLRVCEIMSHAHSRGVIHRDLKPANVLVGSFGDVRVIDWGSAHVLEATRKNFEETFVPLNREVIQTERGEAMWGAPGSPLATAHSGQPITVLFMPPEILLGHADQLGPQTDVYSMGVMLYELLAGRLPYSRPDGSLPSPAELRELVLGGPPEAVRRIQRAVSRDLAAICEKAMARSMAGRYASTAELAEDIHAVLEIRPVKARKTGLLRRLQKWSHRHAFHALSLGAVLAVVSIAFSVSHVLRSERDAARQVTALRSAELAARSGQWREALRFLDEAEAAGFNDSVHLGLERAEAWTVLSEPKRARAELDRLAQRSGLGERRGAVLLRVGEHELFEKDLFERGVQSVREALAAGLTGADRAFATGLLAESTPEALEWFRKALQLDPYHHSAHRHGMGLEFMLARHEELETHIRVFKVLFPEDPSGVFLEAASLAARGRLTDAMDQIESLKDVLDPDVRAQLTSGFQTLASAAERYDVKMLLDGDPAAEVKGAGLFASLTLVPLAASPPVSSSANAMPRVPRLPCLHHYHEGATALAGLALPGFADPDTVVQKIKESWRRHPEALLPAFAALLLDGWHPPSGPKALPLLATQAELFQTAADSPSVLPALANWARYQAASTQFELAGSAHPNAAAARAACLENARRAAAAEDASPAECRAHFEMAFALGDHELSRALLSQWERREPNDPSALRCRIELEVASGAFASALAKIDHFLAVNPADEWGAEQRALLMAKLKELIEAASSPHSNPSQQN